MVMGLVRSSAMALRRAEISARRRAVSLAMLAETSVETRSSMPLSWEVTWDSMRRAMLSSCEGSAGGRWGDGREPFRRRELDGLRVACPFGE